MKKTIKQDKSKHEKKSGGKYNMTLVIEHDNGIKAQWGVTEHEINEKSEIESIIRRYHNCGIVVYNYYIAV